MRHVMLDIETFGTRPGSVIRSIGAVMFDMTGQTGETFYRNIDRKSCENAGLRVDPKTEAWWREQSPAARQALEHDPRPLGEVVAAFNKWFAQQRAEIVWAQGANFDPPLWGAASVACGVDVPWRFFNVRDTRTAYDICKFETRDLRRKNVHHNALDDAVYQVDCVTAAIRSLNSAGSLDVFS